MSDQKAPSFTPDAIRQRYVEATIEVERIRALAKPHRDARDAVLAEMQPLLDREKELIAVYIEIEKPLYDLEMERAALNRAMGSSDRQEVAKMLDDARQKAG